MSEARSAAAVVRPEPVCAHCGLPVPAGRVLADAPSFCCAGCEIVAGAIAAHGLDQLLRAARGQRRGAGAGADHLARVHRARRSRVPARPRHGPARWPGAGRALPRGPALHGVRLAGRERAALPPRRRRAPGRPRAQPRRRDLGSGADHAVRGRPLPRPDRPRAAPVSRARSRRPAPARGSRAAGQARRRRRGDGQHHAARDRAVRRAVRRDVGHRRRVLPVGLDDRRGARARLRGDPVLPHRDRGAARAPPPPRSAAVDRHPRRARLGQRERDPRGRRDLLRQPRDARRSCCWSRAGSCCATSGARRARPSCCSR